MKIVTDLFDGTSPHSFDFKTNICQYNAAFAFASLGVNIDHSIIDGTGPYSFRISGELHHLADAILPLPNQISCLLSFLIQTLILFSLKLSQIACFMVPMGLSSLRLLAWSIESVASIIPRSLMKTPYMEKTVILSMPGQTMDVQCGKIIMTTTTDMSFHIMVLLLSSKFFCLFLKK